MISFVLSGVMSAFMTAFNIGFAKNYPIAMLTGWAVGFIVSYPTAIVIVPLVVRWQMGAESPPGQTQLTGPVITPRPGLTLHQTD